LFKHKRKGGVIMARTTGVPIGNFRGRLGKFSDESAATTEKYNKKIICHAVATKSAYNEIVRYSQSLSLPSN
jgi:hypothetical protein